MEEDKVDIVDISSSIEDTVKMLEYSLDLYIKNEVENIKKDMEAVINVITMDKNSP